ncbi:kalirin RhoGEF kinase [Homo sapiens]|uniref:HCG2022551, isoform CRA_f n=1 Tax=Homo sapiens TaxID=9606 RepID=A0A0D9SGH1_HUMAN|nr:hCG2022551, isoform CRA_f [Homo sapiens]KAI2531214.1 kalirin RhoGEF kinase [Homo sapiens]KAI4031283.1 kalirin RhoGEF kinase [Homo sapiens]
MTDRFWDQWYLWYLRLLRLLDRVPSMLLQMTGFPFYRLSLHSVDCFPCCAEAF